MEIESTFSPSLSDVEFLTERINADSRALGIQETAYPFAFFVRDEEKQVVAGCNGSIIYGSIYTDQIWVHRSWRGQGYGRELMKKVHKLGRERGCRFASVSTMSFQEARRFYEHLGYKCDFERSGYARDSTCIFMKKTL